MIAGLVALAAVFVLGARVATVCEGQVGCMVVAGDNFTDAADVPIPVIPGDGYDGQFYYRQSRSPLDLSLAESNGVELDTEVRFGRIGYPIVVWTLSAGGQPALVPWAMALVQVAALGAVGWVLAVAARDAARSSWWGLAACAVPGLWFAAGRDLIDPLAAALMGLAVLALARRRWGWAAALMTAAVVTKEQAILVPIAYGAWRCWTLLAARIGTPQRRADRATTDPAGVADLPWVVPVGALVLWQGLLWWRTGVVPLAEAGGKHVVAPFSRLVPNLVDWLSPSGATQLLWLVELAVLIALGLVVLVSRTSRGWERVTAVAMLAVLVALNDNVFADPSHFRQFGELSVVLLIAAFRAPRVRWAPLVAANAGVTAVVLWRLTAAV
jgi:hypothetical protein